MSNQRLDEYDKIILNCRTNIQFSSYSIFIKNFEQSVMNISYFFNKRNKFKLFNLTPNSEFENDFLDSIFSRIKFNMEDKREFIENFYFTYYANKNEFLPYLKENQKKFNQVLSASLYLKSEKIFVDILSIKKSKIKDFIINFLIYYIEKNKSFEDFKNNHLFILLLEKFEIKDYFKSIINNLTFKSQEYHYFLKSINPFFEMIDNKKLLENF